MKEQKICSFTQHGYRLQLLKITETTINGYYQIRENRKIKATFTTLDAAIKKFYALQGSKILQKDIFTNDEEEEKYELVILEQSKTYGWNVKYTISEKQALKLIKNEKLIEDKDGLIGLRTFFTEERYKNVIMKQRNALNKRAVNTSATDGKKRR